MLNIRFIFDELNRTLYMNLILKANMALGESFSTKLLLSLNIKYNKLKITMLTFGNEMYSFESS